MKRTNYRVLLAVCAAVSCGDSGAGSDTNSASGSDSSPSTSANATETTAGTGDNSGTNGTTAGTGGQGMTGTTTAATTAGPETSTTTGPATGSTGPDGTSTTTDGATTTEDGTTGVEPPDCDNMPPVMPEASYLWAANSVQGTISKIDTETVTEVGRYIVRPDSAGSPSRTSVSLTGHVAVANRNGGVTKIYSDESLCQESNGMPGIQTSTDNQFLAWGVEECIAWHTPMNYASQRPVAWGLGVQNPQTCAWEDEELWTSGNNQGGSLDIIVLDGDDGSIKEQIAVPTGGDGLNSDFYGIYGAAVDGDGNFWGSQLGTSGKLIKVVREDMSYKIFDTPDGPHWYGMTVDSDGYVWLCSNTAGRFDPETETWTTAAVGGWTGCMADVGPDGLLWMSNGDGVVGVNRETLQVEKTWAAAGSYGISVGFDGFVWAVANGSTLSKINPETGEFTTYSGLTGAYTYSDMIGFALAGVIIPQ
ncbi:MAG: hypothetical protein H6713_05280 [Myxococcales bacterium]|nr:hypothetical protein [Myxococcales bacterium]